MKLQQIDNEIQYYCHNSNISKILNEGEKQDFACENMEYKSRKRMENTQYAFLILKDFRLSEYKTKFNQISFSQQTKIAKKRSLETLFNSY